MKILLTTPLFPPDTGGAAPYMKELARRLTKEGHSITVLTYTHLPEHIEGVSFVCVNKRRPLVFRLLHYTFILIRVALKNEIIYTQNGSSVELPVGILKIFSRIPLVMHIGDKAAHEHALTHTLIRHIESFAFHNAYKIIENSPKQRPEILPFQEYPKNAYDEYEKSWKSHLITLNTVFTHAS